MAEVSKQIQPLHEWMLAFWSNGSGRPPGFFQMRIKADDERYGRLSKEMDKQSEVLERLDVNMQEIAAEKKLEAERKKIEAERKEERDKRIARWLPVVKWVASVLASAMIALASWGAVKIEPVLRVLWLDYLRAHPLAEKQLKNMSQEEHEPAYSGKQNPGESSVEPH